MIDTKIIINPKTPVLVKTSLKYTTPTASAATGSNEPMIAVFVAPARFTAIIRTILEITVGIKASKRRFIKSDRTVIGAIPSGVNNGEIENTANAANPIT